jgi:hypothetical protein
VCGANEIEKMSKTQNTRGIKADNIEAGWALFYFSFIGEKIRRGRRGIHMASLVVVSVLVLVL